MTLPAAENGSTIEHRSETWPFIPVWWLGMTSADSAALARAMRMSDPSEMKAEAKKYAQMNIAGDDQILADADVQRGTWDFDPKTFTVGGANANAIRVTTRMSQANGNAAGTPRAFVALSFEISNRK